MTAARDVLRERLGLEGLTELRPGEFAAQVDSHRLPALADQAAGAGLRLATLFAMPLGDGPRLRKASYQDWILPK